MIAPIIDCGQAVLGGELDDPLTAGTENDAGDDGEGVGLRGHDRGKCAVVVAVANLDGDQLDAKSRRRGWCGRCPDGR
jgi:hypothetical protein